MTALDELFRVIESWTGICLARGGATESLRRFARARAKELGVASVEAYVEQLAGPLRSEREVLINAVTVNYTWFYRDEEQLDALGTLLREGWPTGAALNVWVPGCATGEDAYAVAMLAQRAGRAATVLGTDINSSSVAFAREGRYGAWSMRELPGVLRPFFAPAGNGALRVDESARHSVSFEQHNLVDAPKRPAAGGWDLVLCRNVLIYFSREGAEAAHERLGATLAPKGWLVLGATESVWREPPGLVSAQLAGRAALYRPAYPGAAMPAPVRGLAAVVGAGPAREVGTGAAAESARESARVGTEALRELAVRAARGGPPEPEPETTRNSEARVGAGAARELSARTGAERLAAGVAPEASRERTASGGAGSATSPAPPRPDAAGLLAEGARLMKVDLAEAISRLAKARELDPLCVEAHLHLGIAFHLSGDALSAAPPLRSALLLDPSLWPAAFYLALTYENLGQAAEARREYQRVLDHNGAALNLEVRGVLGDMEAWKADVLALSRRRAAPRR